MAALVPLAQWVGLDNPGQQVTDVNFQSILENEAGTHQQVYCPSSRQPPALLPLLLSLLVVHNILKAAPSPATNFLIGK